MTMAAICLGKKSSIATRITVEQPNAPAVCYGHSLNLKQLIQLTSLYELLDPTMGTLGEICALVKLFPKKENLLGTICEQVERKVNDENDTNQFSSLDKLCITRWTIHANCFQKIINDYS